MGRPFEKELNNLENTFSWASSIDVSDIISIVDKYSHPVYIVGSGGSLSACYFAASLFTELGIIAKAITPLELFFSKNTLRNANIIFISASGKNTDILFGFKQAAEAEPVSILNICMKTGTKLGALSAKYSNCKTIELSNPAGKDGFLATNSLLAYFVVLYRAIAQQPIGNLIFGDGEEDTQEFVNNLNEGTVISVLYSSYSQSVAYDIESKCTEAGLCPILLSDYRNFAHGRHHWFDKQKKSAIIMLVNPVDELLCKRTVGLLPDPIPKIMLNSKASSYESSIQLLIRSFTFVKLLGKRFGIDPGRPGVPEYGSKIYNLKYEHLIAPRDRTGKLSSTEERAILRKTKKNAIGQLNQEEIALWDNAYRDNIDKLTGTRFGCVIFDYDGTLCSSQNRFNGISKEVGEFIIQILKAGIVVGVVSGRGKSLRTDFEKIFSKSTSSLRSNIVLGYYNGSDIAALTDDTKPNKNKALHKSLVKVKKLLTDINVKFDESPYQLTIGAGGLQKWDSLKAALLHEIMLLNLPDIQMVESSHSIDILPRREGSKNNIIAHCLDKCHALGISQSYLCIGDKGQWPGNDYALLSNSFSISVGEVSGNSNTCWNICPPGVANVEGLKYLQSKFKIESGYFTLQL